jgi:hypothetical protein
MTDYRRMLKLAGIAEEMIEQIVAEREQQDADDARDAEEEARWTRERGIEKNIQLIARQTGVELWDNYPVYIDGDDCEVKIDTGSGMPLSHLLHFANALAKNSIGSDLQIQGSADLFITVSFKLL